jgi:transcription antitermination factor NusG
MASLTTIDSRVIATDREDRYTQALWYAGHTASRHEKRIAEQLKQRSVEHFLPLFQTIHRWKNGRHRVELPLFPGYVFVHITLRERSRVLEIPGFVRLVGFSSIPCPLPDTEIEAIRDTLKLGIKTQPYPYLTIGTRVEIRNGPLQGMTGILVQRRGQCRVVLSIDLIRRSMAVEVSSEDVGSVKVLASAGGKTARTRAVHDEWPQSLLVSSGQRRSLNRGEC